MLGKTAEKRPKYLGVIGGPAKKRQVSNKGGQRGGGKEQRNGW